MISVEGRGDFSRTLKHLRKLSSKKIYQSLERYAEKGLEALSSATPKRTGATAEGWGYVVEYNKDWYKITWTNNHHENGMPIALLIQLGHGTGTGGYVQGIDYINPAMRPIFEAMADEVWNEVKRIG